MSVPAAPGCSCVCLVLQGQKGEGRLLKAHLPADREPTQVLEQEKTGIKALRGSPGLTKGRLATCISTDSVMLCRRLRAAGLYGNPQERKGLGSRQGGGGRGREGALSRPRTLRRLPRLGRAPDRGGRGGSSRSLSPSSFPPALLEGLCGRDPEAPGFSSAGWGRAGQPLLFKGKPKVRLVRASLTRGCSREGPGGPDRASLCRPSRPS